MAFGFLHNTSSSATRLQSPLMMGTFACRTKGLFSFCACLWRKRRLCSPRELLRHKVVAAAATIQNRAVYCPLSAIPGSKLKSNCTHDFSSSPFQLLQPSTATTLSAQVQGVRPSHGGLHQRHGQLIALVQGQGPLRHRGLKTMIIIRPRWIEV